MRPSSLPILACSLLLVLTACQSTSTRTADDSNVVLARATSGRQTTSHAANSKKSASQHTSKAQHSSRGQRRSNNVSSQQQAYSSVYSYPSRSLSSWNPANGKTCGGIAGIKCPAGCTCNYTMPPNVSDRSGKCICGGYGNQPVPPTEGGTWWWPF